MKGIGALIAARDFAPLFPIDLVAKDLDYYRHMAVRGGADSPLSKSARDVYVAAQAAGMGGDNIAAIARRYL